MQQNSIAIRLFYNTLARNFPNNKDEYTDQFGNG